MKEQNSSLTTAIQLLRYTRFIQMVIPANYLHDLWCHLWSVLYIRGPGKSAP